MNVLNYCLCCYHCLDCQSRVMPALIVLFLWFVMYSWTWTVAVGSVVMDVAVFEKIDELLPNNLDSSKHDADYYHDWLVVVSLSYLMIC